MKLRIRGNSVRIRVSKSEVAQIEASGFAEDVVRFSPRSALRYRVEVKASGPAAAEFDGSQLRVALPKKAVARWLGPNEVSIEAEQDVGDGVLKILVEKDYACLAPRDSEDDSDLFDHPLQPETQ
ncbi:MAG TPA: hypothetical protein VJA26_00150 [Gammaproteobacteria bacterium]|nr:hypothetical protein [Gammaproteobacteria bacterium]